MTLRWARGREGCFESPLPASGLHPPRNEKGAARPFQTPKLLGSIQKIQVAPLKDFLCCADFKAPQSLRDSSPQGSERQQMQLLATAPSREKANQEGPQSFLICKYKNNFPLKMPRVKRRAFKWSGLR